MSLQIAPALEQRLDHLAIRFNRTPTDLAQEAIERYLTTSENFLAAVEEGRASAERGELHDHEEVMAMLDRILEQR